jgi:hypothetical protein
VIKIVSVDRRFSFNNGSTSLIIFTGGVELGIRTIVVDGCDISSCDLLRSTSDGREVSNGVYNFSVDNILYRD